MDCLFCNIISGKIPSYKVYEDEKCLAFLDIFPANYGHTLIIPKDHFVTIEDLPDELLLHIHQVARKLYKVISKALNTDGITFNQNNGCYQDVKHYHLHLIPRFVNDNQLLRNNKDNIHEKHIDIIIKIREAL